MNNMFNLLSVPLSRREALASGLYGVAALSLGGQSFAQDSVPLRAKAKSVIQIFLWGGMSHNDTWDPKPNSGPDYMGDVKTIPTNVDGIQLSQWFPAMAKQADKFSLIRSMTHRNNGHETAAYIMQTGHQPGERLSSPSVGAVFALFKKPMYKGLIPPYVVLTQPQG